VRFQLRPSRALAAALVAAHAAAGLAVFLLMKDALGAALGAALVALGVAAAWSRALLRGRDAVRSLELSREALAGRPGRRYVSRFLVTLPLRGRTLLVTADMLEPREFRHLRIWALWGELPAVAGEQLVG
jgi:hypothetical protein